MRALGALLLSMGGLLVGLSAAGRLRTRARALREMEKTMALAGYAIGRFRMTTPALAGELAGSAPGAGAALFARLAAAMKARGDLPLDTLWRGALEDVEPAARSCLLAFGAVLGRYGAGEQMQAAERCRMELDTLAAAAEEQAARSGRVYVAVGAAVGTAAAIVML